MKTFFVQFKCELGKAYDVASALADAEIASEIYSTAGHYDLMAKFYIDDDQDVGHFVNEKVQVIPGIKDTFLPGDRFFGMRLPITVLCRLAIVQPADIVG